LDLVVFRRLSHLAPGGRPAAPEKLLHLKRPSANPRLQTAFCRQPTRHFASVTLAFQRAEPPLQALRHLLRREPARRCEGRFAIFRRINLYGKTNCSAHGHQNEKLNEPDFWGLGQISPNSPLAYPGATRELELESDSAADLEVWKTPKSD
jgi:hypothetical protein